MNHTVEEVKALGGYQILYADPPWSYRNGGRGSTASHYETLPDAALSKLPVGEIAAKDAVLFLWATWPNLPVALATMTAWGFTYKTLAFLWVKYYEKSGRPFWGGGFWTRANSEICLLGVRGDLRRIDASVHQIVGTWADDGETLCAPPGEHSAKPLEVRERIVKLMGDLPRIELFARERASGWDAFGDDSALGGSDVEMILTQQNSSGMVPGQSLTHRR